MPQSNAADGEEGRGAASGTNRTREAEAKETAVACLSGVALGCVDGLIALGFEFIYTDSDSEVVNFAQGDLMMLGGLFCAGRLATALSAPGHDGRAP